MRFLLLFISLGLLAATSFGQVPRVGDPEYTAQGRLVILRIVPHDRKADLFLAGHQAADLDLKRDSKILRVTLLDQGNKKILKVSPKGESYEVEGLPDQPRPYELSVLTETRGRTEEIRAKIAPRKP